MLVQTTVKRVDMADGRHYEQTLAIESPTQQIPLATQHARQKGIAVLEQPK